MIHTMRLFLVFVVLSIAAPAHAQDDAKLRDLLSLVGLDTALASISSGNIHALESLPNPGLDESTREAMGSLVAKHFAPSGMKQSIVASMANALTDAQIDKLSAYYSEGLGRRATELEMAAQQPGMEELSDTEGLKILQRLIDTKDARLLSYQRLVLATNSLEMGTALAMNISYAVLSGMMGSAQLPYSLSDEEILAIVNGRSEQIRAQLTEALYVGAAYTYRDLSLEELDAYVAFLETDTARTFYSSMNKALRGALLPRARALGHDLMVLMGARKT